MSQPAEVSYERAHELYEKGRECGEANGIYNNQGVADVAQLALDSSLAIVGRNHASTTLLGIRLGDTADIGTIYLRGNDLLCRQRLAVATAIGHYDVHYEEHPFDYSDHHKQLQEIAPGAVYEVQFGDEMGFATSEARFYAAGLLLGRYNNELPIDKIKQLYEVPQTWAQNHLASLGIVELVDAA